MENFDNSTLEGMSIKDLKELQTRVEKLIKDKTAAMTKQIQEDAKAAAVANGIDPKTIFPPAKRSPRKKTPKQPVTSA